jgi:hypothetical protein
MREGSQPYAAAGSSKCVVEKSEALVTRGTGEAPGTWLL